MPRLTVVFALVAMWVGNSLGVCADPWPKLTNGHQLPPCAEALQIATAVFQSDAFYLYAPPVMPAGIGSVLVLKPETLDVSGGDALEADQAVFDKLPTGGQGAPRSMYWQKSARDGYRVVVHEVPYGWRGDRYTLFALGEDVKPEEFLTAVNDTQSKVTLVPVIADAWRPPLILQEQHSSQLWIIDVGQPYDFLGAWRIYDAARAGITWRCTVQFRPPVRKAVHLLPPPVRTWARLLDQTLGRGENEGTLQPTARLRLDVEHTWANVTLRPWALGEPYNTRAEVEMGLKHWSRQGATYLQAYQQIRRQYPRAEHALAAYYHRTFHHAATEAKALAAYGLDIALRSHYAFHSDDPNRYFRRDKAPSNPWRRSEHGRPAVYHEADQRQGAGHHE